MSESQNNGHSCSDINTIYTANFNELGSTRTASMNVFELFAGLNLQEGTCDNFQPFETNRPTDGLYYNKYSRYLYPK